MESFTQAYTGFLASSMSLYLKAGSQLINAAEEMAVEIVRINKMEAERKRAKATEKQALLQVPIAVDKPIARSEPVPVAVTEMETNVNPDVPLVEIVPEPVVAPESMVVQMDAPDPVVEPVPMEIESDDEPEVTYDTRALDLEPR